ncbi:DEAD/DEAH box helicase family protein [Desulfogranum marinum]|uniref:DEAD/DEAH box helicase family protein n=1 Tax=Desulfogranum marinum TaxID=453220 RepID=UPI001963780F|nr:DEAD/DEAH box helicase family protein [Desulfogranum marinum]MBM9511678.1 DEAD/DEAH box helicase family protein [Desulfogranum marinum]
MSDAEITVVDAVMGTGKSTWAIEEINSSDTKRFVVVLPRVSEITRFKEAVSRSSVVALDDALPGSKQTRFEKALEDSEVILISHSLFESYLKPHVFELLEQGDWHLVVDETTCVFEPINGLSKTMLGGWKAYGIVDLERVNSRLTKIVPVIIMTELYTKLNNFHISKSEREILKKTLYREVYMIEDDSQRGFFSFTLKANRLKPFKSVAVLTYMFADSPMEYWCTINRVPVQHMELLGNGELQPHDRQYSGKQFADLIEVLEPKSKYGSKPNHFSATSSRGLLK